jgi:hypothetical protein
MALAKFSSVRMRSAAGKDACGLWVVRLGSSWLSITGDGSVVPVLGSNSSSVATGTAPSGTRVTDSGFGDVIASAAYRFYRTREPNAAMDLPARVKFGTANFDKGLGSGATLTYYLNQDLNGIRVTFARQCRHHVTHESDRVCCLCRTYEH